MEEQDYRTTYELEDHNWWFVGMRRIGTEWVDRCLAERSSASPVRILDVGCGTGRNIEELRSRGTVVGADVSSTALAFCRARGLGGLVQSQGDRLPMADGSVAMVTAFGVIEHIADDAAALAEWARVLEPGGHLVLLTSAYGWLWSGHDVSNHHHRRYTASELRQALHAAGFERPRVSYANTVLFPPIAAVRLVDRVRRRGRPPAPHKDTAELPAPLDRGLRAVLGAEARFLRRANLPAGVSLVTSAQVPLRSGTNSG